MRSPNVERKTIEYSLYIWVLEPSVFSQVFKDFSLSVKIRATFGLLRLIFFQIPWAHSVNHSVSTKWCNKFPQTITGKNNGFPFLDILGYLKNTHKNMIPNLAKWDKSQPGNSQPSSLIGTCLTLPNLGFLCVFFQNTLKYPKMGIHCFFMWDKYNFSKPLCSN